MEIKEESSPKILYKESQIQKAVKKVSDEINSSHKNKLEIPIFICILNGAFMFFSDLLKQIKGDIEVDFIRVKRETIPFNRLKYIKDIELNIFNRNIYLVDDIYDTGNTINDLIKHLNKFKPKSIIPVTLFKSKDSYNKNLIYGIELKNECFIYGYGLDDLNDQKRNLKYILGNVLKN